MSMALLMALLLPVLQDDPQVTYREGLFEEVDQGNLEKAAELYAKVLKSNAPDALKAKALLRTGFCHEKKGKKKEAEQAWRDVAERFPGAAETVKLARERLAGLKQDGGGTSASLEAQIQSLILGLVSPTPAEREGAIRKLVVIGRPALPELRQALQSRDRELRLSAAYILVQLEEFDGVYEALKSSWGDESDRENRIGYALGETLKAREEDRRKFLKDLQPDQVPKLVSKMGWSLCRISDPAFPKIVEDWLVDADIAWDHSFRLWTENRELPEIRRLAKRLAGAKSQPNEKVVEMLKSCAPAIKQPDPDLKEILLAALAAYSNPMKLFEVKGQRIFPMWILSFMSASEFAKGPLMAWLRRGHSNDQANLLYASLVNPHGDAIPDEIRPVLFDCMTDQKQPMEIRRLILVFLGPPGEALRPRYLDFCRQVLKEDQSKPGDGTSSLAAAVKWLLTYLPADSKDMQEVMLIAAQHGCISGEAIQARSTVLRGPAVAAALQAQKQLKPEEAERTEHLALIGEFGTPAEKAALGPLVGATSGDAAQMAVEVYVSGVLELPKAEQEAAWKSMEKVFESASARMQLKIAERLMDVEDGHASGLLATAVDSPDSNVRASVIWHFAKPIRVAPISRTSILVKGLKDSTEGVQLAAIHGLTVHPDLDAVPEIIGLLNSPFANVRTQARKSLDEIKKHFEAQAEWQRWYDETKKTLKR